MTPQASPQSLRIVKAGVCGLLVIALSGCVTARVEEYMQDTLEMGDGESVVILTNRQDAVIETEDSFSECLYGQLRSRAGDVNIVSENSFKDAMFPWFEPRLAPTRAEAVTSLLEEPRIAAKVDEMNVRYLVWIHGESEARNKQGVMTCTLSPAGGGCLGVLSWDNNSTYEASIWDVQEGQSMGIISAEATGTSVIPALGVPLPLIARTKSASCKSLGQQLGELLTGP
ncbi:MAG: hypothetical protein AAGA23_07420 [Pseudomonadota bacterium]